MKKNRCSISKLLIFTTLIFGAFDSYSKNLELKTGDILLQPLHCWACTLIEEQERTNFSHIGVYVEIANVAFVLEAWGQVKLTPLKDFLAKTEKGEKVLVKRFVNKKFDEFDIHKEMEPLLGLSYDSSFMWDNWDEKGEKIYCSELVYKLFDKFYTDLPLKKMSFDVNRNYWERYFRGNVPDGLPGNSPGDFERSALFLEVGEL